METKIWHKMEGLRRSRAKTEETLKAELPQAFAESGFGGGV